ncbi:relaxase/mobilization nuclease domain-containing protein [Pedobacter sp. ISL-68]|uniref:relaxase/mobilization nuclease domain-containing protein n=1 Tax=unclassified Pedobacter TaxID=2628915 RepID=UPI001BEA2F98|nr:MULTISPECIES: relaxase/mobilization nuclease domain-containing protein [unclassified Pedobacter]MBT2561698.1 relaxase/mobilization nuclease domain-containing protein [Pedobacter sp. ISL-64]MBT2591086.1 relaxase/mobilization nuclease domain-containing protein [Pedobacter sp. ISL-68]
MIGHVSIGSSFYHLIRYCLEDKKELSEEKKQELSMQDNLQHQQRAEVLEYNQCFGNKQELTEQFKDVRKLSRRVEKPVLHLSLRLAPGEVLTKAQLMEMGRACALEFGVADNQYICVLHKDTKEQHIHIAANRVGFNGKVASDSNSYKRMAALCRRLEKQYGLQEVLSPRAFLPPKERHLPRHDSRKEKLRDDIRSTLERVTDYPSFEKKMQALGYTVLKGRGISFIDDKKVKIKGSEVGFSLAKIERVFSVQQQLVMHRSGNHHRLSNANAKAFLQNHTNPYAGLPVGEIEKQLTGILSELLKPEYAPDYVDPALIREAKKKHKKKPNRKIRR